MRSKLPRQTLKLGGRRVGDFSVIAALGFVNMTVSGAVSDGVAGAATFSVFSLREWSLFFVIVFVSTGGHNFWCMSCQWIVLCCNYYVLSCLYCTLQKCSIKFQIQKKMNDPFRYRLSYTTVLEYQSEYYRYLTSQYSLFKCPRNICPIRHCPIYCAVISTRLTTSGRRIDVWK